MPNNTKPPSPPFTFSRNELPSGDEGERLDRILRRIQTAFSTIDFPTPPPLNLNALAAKLRPLLEAPGSFPLNLTALVPSSSGGSSADISVTHAVRLAVYTPPSVPIGTTLFETDRAITYIVYDNSGTLVWKYSGGVMYNTLANIPTDLGTFDVGFLFVNSDADQNSLYVWTGTEFVTVGYLQSVLDAVTNAATTVQILRHLTSGTAAAGYAARQVWQLENGAGTTTSFGLQDVEILTSTAGSEDGLWRWWLIAAGALANIMTLYQSGALRMIGSEPKFQWYESDEGADEKLWDVGPSAQSLLFRTRTDANGAGSTWMSVTRNPSTTPSDWSLIVGLITAAIVSGSGFSITQSTLGTVVHQLISTTSNDDPSENTYQNKVLTTDATATTLHTIACPASTTMHILAFVTARRTGGAAGTAEDGASYQIEAAIKNVAGTATIIGAVGAIFTAEDQAGWDATITVSGANARVTVTGALDNNVSWACTVKTYPIGT